MFKGLEINFTSTLIDWYQINKRNLPWRGTKDPYRVWVSEIILQQTRVEQGLPYYHKFIKKAPDVVSLANLSENELLLLWQGLGYYSRALNLHKSAKIIASQFTGEFPNKYDELLKLPGVGPYSAAAISSFCFKEKKPVLDGNVYRFISRLFGIYSEINKPKTRTEFLLILDRLIPDENPDVFNQAIMEFGALQCVPKNPNCEKCFFQESCYAFNKNEIKSLPVKKTAGKKRIRHLNFLVFTSNNNIIIEKRGNEEIWKNLFQFPLVETKTRSKKELAVGLEEYSLSLPKTKLICEDVHLLSHQKLMIRFYSANSSNPLKTNLISVPINTLMQYAFPKTIQNFINDYITFKDNLS